MGVQFGEMGAEQRSVIDTWLRNSPGIVGKLLEKLRIAKLGLNRTNSLAHVEIRRATETTRKMPQ